MPYKNASQAPAIFAAIKRTKGLQAATDWADKHSAEMSKGMKGNHNASGKKKKKKKGQPPPYTPRSAR